MPAKIDHTGESNIATCGMKMTIIKYHNYQHVDVQFEDGIIVTNKTYRAFRNGVIAHSSKSGVSRIGETNIARNGLKMTIIKYRSANDIDVKFEDGIIVTNKPYHDFKRGAIGHPSIMTISKNLIAEKRKHIGETNIAKNGLKMTIVEYRNSNDVDVQFEDGVIATNKSYYNFKKGTTLHPTKTNNDRIGETNIANNGMKMTIIAYHRCNNIEIQFEDGIIVTNKEYSDFKMGKVKHPNISTSTAQAAKKYIGKKNIANNGLKMTIIGYRNYNDIDIQFEDGAIVNNARYNCFKRGFIKHSFPYQMNNDIIIEKPAYIHNNVGNFYYTCQKCHCRDIMSINEIKEHKC